MRYDHTVKYKGKYYPAGAEVPVLENKSQTSHRGKV